MPAMLESWILAVKDGLQNVALPSLPETAQVDTMPSLRTFTKLAFGGAQVLLGGQRVVGTFTHSCPNPELSCHNSTVVEDLCCFNAPGGQLLQTQFWDTNPPTGPSDSWTLHGLWPDRCDGTYEANCDPSRAYTNISAIITSFGANDLLTYMSTYWKDYKGNDESFWEHEWAKHGTCISTLSPDCYADHKPAEEVVDYFQKAVDLFKSLPSYEWLKEAGVEPSADKTYTFAQIQDALAAKRPGVQVTLGCKSGVFNEIWYHYDVRGALQTGEFVAADPDGTKSTCPQTGIKYLPKGNGGGGGSSPPSTTTTGDTPQPTSTAAPGSSFSGRGYLNVMIDGKQTGCLIGKGTWYTSGTCATFTAASASDAGFTLSSSKGKCAVVGGALACDGSVSQPTTFSAVEGNLAAGGNARWSADQAASGSTQQKVFAGGDHSLGFAITWQGA